jgi:hypothetical protein
VSRGPGLETARSGVQPRLGSHRPGVAIQMLLLLVTKKRPVVVKAGRKLGLSRRVKTRPLDGWE